MKKQSRLCLLTLFVTQSIFSARKLVVAHIHVIPAMPSPPPESWRTMNILPRTLALIEATSLGTLSKPWEPCFILSVL